MRNKGYEAAFFTGAMFVFKKQVHLIIGDTNVQNEWMEDVLKRMDASAA